MQLIKLALTLTIIGNLSAAQTYQDHVIHSSLVRAPSRLGPVQVNVKQDKLSAENYSNFSVVLGGKEIEVNSYDVNPKVRNAVKFKALGKYLQSGHLIVNEGTHNGNKFYSIDGQQTGKGGGPGLGVLVYGLVKGSLYGLVGVGVTATVGGGVLGVVATGGTLLLPASGAIAATTAALTPAIVATASAATAASVGTTAGVLTVGIGTTGGLIAFIEGVSLAAGFACGMAPTP